MYSNASGLLLYLVGHILVSISKTWFLQAAMATGCILTGVL